VPKRKPLDRPAQVPEDPGKARDERRQRARDEFLEVLERTDRPFPSFEVRNPVHGTRYRVLGPEVPEILLCPCPDFGRRDVGTCKHVEAVRAYLREPSPVVDPSSAADPAPSWAAIETAVGSYAARPVTDLRPLWKAGRLLLGETGP
jgi:hypothetical protein